ncbi:MAG: hypothetical protein IT423_11650, partial [Pirellulaceae bacterium]|nr:hypothetical protein [Pirellulaceae bacterium]
MTFRLLWLLPLVWLMQSSRILAIDDQPPENSGDKATEVGSQPSPEAIDFFESKIRPLLHQHCIECHNDDQAESGLSLESHAGLMRGGKLGAAVIPGKPRESLLISAVNHDEFLKMPPKDKLTTVELVALSKWVTMGAPWPESKSLKSPKPTPKNDGPAGQAEA